MTDALFNVIACSTLTAISCGTATQEQAMALADELAATGALGAFRQLCGASVELRFPGDKAAQVQAFIEALPMETLDARVAQRAATAQAAREAEEAAAVLRKMPLRQFGAVLQQRSGEKLRMSAASGDRRLVLSASDLLPVTHFKTLARLTNYDGRAKTFELVEAGGDRREGLLALADMLAKSTKKVTRADIDARRAARPAARHEPTADEIEDHLADFYGCGFDDPKVRAEARRALMGARQPA